MQGSRLKIKKLFFGMNIKDGLIFKTLLYLLLIGIGFVYVYPLLYMVSVAFQSLQDLLSPNVYYVPTQLYWSNVTVSFEVLRYFDTLLSSLTVTLVPAILQTIISSFIGYGFARF